MNVLSIASAMLGLITVALAIHHWHLGSLRRGVASRPRRRPDPSARWARVARAGTEATGVSDVPAAPGARPRSPQRSGIFPRALWSDPSTTRAEQETEPRPRRGAGARSAHDLAPFGLGQRGVYTTSELLAAPEQRGQRVAERVLSDALAARTRRGRKAALDVIVIGASREGVAATLCLLAAGLRVLLVDAGSGEGPRAVRLGTDSSLASALRALRRERLPIVWGHRVLGVDTRPDGMLELSAERAAWYTANVIVAVTSESQREHAA